MYCAAATRRSSGLADQPRPRLRRVAELREVERHHHPLRGRRPVRVVAAADSVPRPWPVWLDAGTVPGLPSRGRSPPLPGPIRPGRSERRTVTLPAMSARTRDLPRRSCLSVPGSSEKMLGQGPDHPRRHDVPRPRGLGRRRSRRRRPGPRSSTPSRTRTGATRSCASGSTPGTPSGPTCDVIEVVGNAGERLEEIMLPKVQTRGRGRGHRPAAHPGREERRPARSATSASRPRSRRPAASSTSTRSAPRRPASRRSSSARSTSRRRWRCRRSRGGLQIPEYPGDYFHYVFMKILMAGRANGLQVIDGPYVKVRDPEGFRDFCTAHPDPRLRRQVGAAPRPGHDPQRGVLAHPGAVRQGAATCSTPTRRRPPRATARAR